MASVTFLWHLHQPAYRTADGVSHAPWVLLHAGGAYTTLARAISETGARGHVVNIVPTLLEQLEAYRDGRVSDAVIDDLTTPAAELDIDRASRLLDWAFHVTPRQLDRYPRLRDLGERHRGSDPRRSVSYFGTGDLRDLQVLFVLAQAGEQAWQDHRLAPLFERGRHFRAADHEKTVAWLEDQPRRLIDLWHQIEDQPGVEIATSPFAHPIMPLLIDSEVVRESWAPAPAPAVPDFRHPEDAAWQLERGLKLMRDRGFKPEGCWPPEGSVSTQALETYHAAGVRWLVTDEGILERSLGRPLRATDRVPVELYSPWRHGEGPVLFFRDRWLSDRIGFVYGNWEDENRAAEDLVRHLEGVAKSVSPDAAIVIALDGENAWLHYPQAGGTFLRRLMRGLNEAGPHLEPKTFAELVDQCPTRPLDRLHPGSWINSVFATWIGHPEKTAAWRVLARVRETLAKTGNRPPEALLPAEGSDWFWWLGDDNPTQLAPLYDHIFRRHLRDACEEAGIAPPVDLSQPLKTVTRPVRIPVTSQWRRPELDGRITNYFEWSLATWIDTENGDPVRRVALWASPDAVYLLIQSDVPFGQLLEEADLVIRLVGEEGDCTEARISRNLEVGGGPTVAIGAVLEAELPWTPGRGMRFEIRVANRLVTGSTLLLEPFDVDEDVFAQPERSG